MLHLTLKIPISVVVGFALVEAVESVVELPAAEKKLATYPDVGSTIIAYKTCSAKEYDGLIYL